MGFGFWVWGYGREYIGSYQPYVRIQVGKLKENGNYALLRV